MTTEIDLSKAKVGEKYITDGGHILSFVGTFSLSSNNIYYEFTVDIDGDSSCQVRKLNNKDGTNLFNRKFDIVKKVTKPVETVPSTQCPSHYNNSWVVGDFIRDQQLSFHLGNAIKYICRCDKKGQKIEDLQKAIHYLNNELEHETRRASTAVPSSIPGPEYFEWSSLPDH